MDANHGTWTGRIVAELKIETQGKYTFCNFTIVNERRNKKFYFPCVVYGQRAIALVNNMEKGAFVTIEGELMSHTATLQSGALINVPTISCNLIIFGENPSFEKKSPGRPKKEKKVTTVEMENPSDIYKDGINTKFEQEAKDPFERESE